MRQPCIINVFSKVLYIFSQYKSALDNLTFSSWNYGPSQLNKMTLPGTLVNIYNDWSWYMYHVRIQFT